MLPNWLLFMVLPSIGQPLSSPAQHIILSPLTKTAYSAAQKHCITTVPRLTFPVKKFGKKLLIPTTGGQKILRDALVAEDNPDWEKYTYLGYSAQGAYHLILRNHYEWSGYILIQQNGRRLDVPSAPIFSPDTSAFVVASASLDYEMMPNSLQLFRRDRKGWRQMAKVEPKTWEPSEISWLSATTLLLRQKHWSKDFARTWYTYAKLTIR